MSNSLKYTKKRSKNRLKAIGLFLGLPVITSISSFLLIGGIFSLILSFLLAVIVSLKIIPAIFTIFKIKKPIWFKYLIIYGIHRRELTEEERKKIKNTSQHQNRKNMDDLWTFHQYRQR